MKERAYKGPNILVYQEILLTVNVTPNAHRQSIKAGLGSMLLLYNFFAALPTKSAFFILLSSDVVHKDAPLEAILSQYLFLPGKSKLKQYIFTVIIFSESGNNTQINIAS